MSNDRARGREDSSPATHLAALAWGFAEATLFFIVPDVLLSWIALRHPRAAWIACVWAAVGALAGGTVMYAWGAADPESALVALRHVPAVSPAMCRTVEEQIRARGVGAAFFGPVTGTPYKVYAVQASMGQVGLVPFLLVSFPSRLLRFVFVTGLTLVLCRLFARTTLFVRRLLHGALWTTFYGWYFWTFRVMN